MATKIFVKNNYLFLDIPNESKDLSDIKSNVFIYKTNDTTKEFSVGSPHFGNYKVLLSDLVDEDSNSYTEAQFIDFYTENTGRDTGSEPVDLALSDLGRDAWGKPKFIIDKSIVHGMFTYNVPVITWYETFNGAIQDFTNATSVNGKLNLVAGATNTDITYLRTFRNPRYEPNRGYIYSISAFLPNPTASGNRKWGYFTTESGVFFSLESGILKAVIRTTIDSVTSDTKIIIDTTDIDLSKGNLFDIQMQWRGVGLYGFYINQKLVQVYDTLGTMVDLTIFNPANPIAFECENLGDNVVIQCGCVDISTEGGQREDKTYGSISMTSEEGQVSVPGPSQFNVPILAVRSKLTVNGLINTRDTLALLATGYADQRAFIRVWATRDFTAITENDQSWGDFGDGHLEYILFDEPDVATPMTFDTTKASEVFGSRVDIDSSYSTSALFEGRTEIYQTPGDMFIFTLHRENGGSFNGGVTYEFGEEI